MKRPRKDDCEREAIRLMLMCQLAKARRDKNADLAFDIEMALDEVADEGRLSRIERRLLGWYCDA
jgi:hypothetical protein